MYEFLVTFVSYGSCSTGSIIHLTDNPTLNRDDIEAIQKFLTESDFTNATITFLYRLGESNENDRDIR